MAFFNGWPWANFQEQNLDWIIREIKSINSKIEAGDDISAEGIHFIKLTDDPYSLNPGELLIINDGQDHYINGTINADILFIDGTISGGDININGQILAGRNVIFGNYNTLSINPEKCLTGYPEWFSNWNSTDSAPAINTCIEVFRETSLACKDYHIFSPILMTTSHRILVGEKINQTLSSAASEAGTRIISHSCNGIIVGDITEEYGVTTTIIQNLSLITFEDFTSEYAGIYMKYARAAYLNNITISNFKRGVRIEYATLCYLYRVRYICSKAANNDAETAGFYLVLGAASAGVISSIASVYLTECDATFINLNRYNFGVRTAGNGPISDLIFTNFNTAQAGTGVYIAGSADGTLQQNVEFLGCVIDNNGEDAVNLYGPIRANFCQCHLSVGGWGSNTKHAMYIRSNKDLGCIEMAGCSIKAGANPSGQTFGIRATNATNLHISASVTGCAVPVSLLNTIDSYINSEIINNAAITSAIILENCSRIKVDSAVSGSEDAATGVQITSATSHCLIDATRLDRATKKVTYAGAEQSQAMTPLTNNNMILGVL